MAGARGFAPADPDPGGADPAGVRFWPGSGLKILAGVRPRPGSGSKNLAGVKPRSGSGSKVLAGVKPRPGSGSKFLAGVKPRLGSGSKILAGVIAPIGVSRGHYPERKLTPPGSGSAGAKRKPRAPAITARLVIICLNKPGQGTKIKKFR